nr:hypothetical protein BaRGS_031592 [Batillaria attramentaria]
MDPETRRGDRTGSYTGQLSNTTAERRNILILDDEAEDKDDDVDDKEEDGNDDDDDGDDDNDDPFQQGAQMCPNEWTSFDYSCYIVGTDMVSWTEAEEMCRIFDSDLVVIETQSENEFLKRLLSSHHSANHVWIGATDIFSEGTFVWLRTFEEVSGFTDWAAGEPNHAHGANSEDCVQMTGEHGWQWNDESCKELSYFVCEKRVLEDVIINFA